MKRSNHKILIISYFFPPNTGAGVQRPLRLVKNLINSGWDVTVLTSTLDITNLDFTLSKKIPKETSLVYMDDPLQKLLKKINSPLFHKVISFLLFPDRVFFWYFFNRNSVLKLLSQKSISTVYITVGPYSASLFGSFIKKRMPEIKFILDYRDAWTNNPSVRYSKFKPLFTFLNLYVEKYVNSFADVITTVSNFLTQEIITVNKEKIKVLYNGYDSSDFKTCRRLAVEEYNIFFSGSLYAERNPDLFLTPFLHFYNKLDKKDKDLISLTFVGDSRTTYIQKITDIIPGSIKLKIENYIPHEDLLDLASQSALLLLLVDNIPGAKGVVTGKVFEYINLPSPILGIVPLDGEAAKVIKDTNTGFVFEPGKIDCIVEFLFNDFHNWKKDPLRKDWNNNKNVEIITKYSDQHQFLEFKKACLIG